MKRIDKFNRITFIIVIGIFFAILFYKAVILPVVTDEAITAVIFVNYTVRDIIMYTDQYPNNHILNTLFTKLLVTLFGNEQVIIRLPNLLFFIVYGIGIYRIIKNTLKENSIFFLPVTLLFISNPYLLDFFGLCRGYGMSCALATLSLSYLISAFQYSKPRHAWIAWFLSILASYAHFTLLVFWIAISIMIVFFFFSTAEKKLKRMGKPMLIMALFTIIYLALIANPIIRMQQANEFRFWSADSFYKDTIYALIEYSRSGSLIIPGSHFIAGMAFTIIIINLIYVVVHFRQSHFNISSLREPVFVSTMVLLLTALVNIIQVWLLNTPNLHGRTALFFYPLFISVLVSFIGIIPRLKFIIVQKVIAIGLVFICIFHVADRFKLDWVRDNWQSVNTFEVMDYLREHHNGETVSLEAYWFLYHSFNYYVFTGKVPWLKLEGYDERLDLNTNAEYYYIFVDNLKALESKFEPVQRFGNNRLLVKKRKDQ